MSVNEYRKYELLECVSIIQRQRCMRANEYRSTSCCHVSASYSARAACARRYELLTCVSIIQRQGHARETSSQVRAVGMCKHHTAAGLHELTGTAPGLYALKTSFASTSC
jgi:hypothetical protein